MSDDPRHIPVLEMTVMELLSPKLGETVIDCTLGLGGHAQRFLECIGNEGKLIGIDADQKNLRDASERLEPFASAFVPVHGNFGDIREMDLPAADIVFADLGLSSPHIDEADRGFSFRMEGPLDLRFDRLRGKPASQMLEEADENEIVFVLRKYGEIQDVRRFIAAIRSNPPKTTSELVTHAEEAYGWKTPKLLPQIFQSLRIWVNDEIGSLERLLAHLPSITKNGARVGIISYHSLEDRLVKHTFRALSTSEKDPVTGRTSKEASWEMPQPKGIQPSEQEMQSNPRSRSARFRIIHRIAS